MLSSLNSRREPPARLWLRQTSVKSMNDADHPDDQPAALLAGLLAADRGAAAALLRAALQRPDADAAALAQTLLQQPQAQLRAHGLLAARLAGRADLVLAALTAGDCGIWKATAFHLCQVGVACSRSFGSICCCRLQLTS